MNKQPERLTMENHERILEEGRKLAVERLKFAVDHWNAIRDTGVPEFKMPVHDLKKKMP